MPHMISDPQGRPRSAPHGEILPDFGRRVIAWFWTIGHPHTLTNVILSLEDNNRFIMPPEWLWEQAQRDLQVLVNSGEPLTWTQTLK